MYDGLGAEARPSSLGKESSKFVQVVAVAEKVVSERFPSVQIFKFRILSRTLIRNKEVMRHSVGLVFFYHAPYK